MAAALQEILLSHKALKLQGEFNPPPKNVELLPVDALNLQVRVTFQDRAPRYFTIKFSELM